MSTVAIIGAGPAGLVAAREAKACGLHPTVFEKDATIGGLWKPDAGFIWDDMRTNISYHTNAFSDFSWKDGVQDFPTGKEVYEYLRAYADAFKIHPHVQLNTEVKKIQREGSSWRVEIYSADQSHMMHFDYVLICSGIFSRAHIPQIPGLDTFPGDVLHSKDYKRADALEGKNVVVIGNAFSGCDIAVSLAKKAAHIFHVQRKPMWVMPRYLPQSTGKLAPCDLIFYSRAADARSLNLPQEVINTGKDKWFRHLCGEQEALSPDLQIPLDPTTPPFVTISDGYLDAIKGDKISVKTGSIRQVLGNTLQFEDESTLQADALVFCTGYRTDISFLSPEDQALMEYSPEDPLQPFLLHRAIFPKGLPDIACIGLYRGPFFGVMELQARLACMLFAKQIPPLADPEIQEGILAERAIRDTFPRPQFPHGNYVSFCEAYAASIEALPDYETIKTAHPELYRQLWDGPFSVASYRLTGFGSNPKPALQRIDAINGVYT